MPQNFTIKQNISEIDTSLDIVINDDSWLLKFNDFSFIFNPLAIIFDKFILKNYLKNIELALILTDSKSIQKLNKQFRNKDKSTNSLSFPANENMIDEIKNLKNHDGFIFLGDIVFSYEVVLSEAIDQNLSFENHFIHLVVHGILHLLGFDHELDKEAEKMERLEIEILAELSIKSPY